MQQCLLRSNDQVCVQSPFSSQFSCSSVGFDGRSEAGESCERGLPCPVRSSAAMAAATPSSSLPPMPFGWRSLTLPASTSQPIPRNGQQYSTFFRDHTSFQRPASASQLKSRSRARPRSLDGPCGGATSGAACSSKNCRARTISMAWLSEGAPPARYPSLRCRIDEPMATSAGRPNRFDNGKPEKRLQNARPTKTTSPTTNVTLGLHPQMGRVSTARRPESHTAWRRGLRPGV
mmetsp:Transcript_79738/g.223719  ORF Transcript_79738/g.223719 Transcript_79738/m.223719 type:complete len:233 (+) Transcript_79738:551-1249(+)